LLQLVGKQLLASFAQLRQGCHGPIPICAEKASVKPTLAVGIA
jgi:hypothetical protein